ncbi:histidine phosphatase family protein [Candidatus Acetothermia bacterium]|nr:histidine phosphatase family protein [Candidatus Acetothermia bacterium]MBI3644312.1 histidine phosphatase family protein [Candidatus Acetothermia bacterium]
MSKHIIYLIRHGYYDSQSEDQLEGGLTLMGIEQTERVAQRLKALPIKAISSSILKRAVETALIIGKNHPEIKIQQSSELCECIPCVSESAKRRWPMLAQIPQEIIESGKMQADSAFKRYFKESASDEHEIIVCHGNIIRYFVCRALNLPDEIWFNLEIANCGLTQICIEPGRISLISHNDVGHLPDELVTYS